MGLAGVAFAALLWLFAQQAWWGAALSRLFPDQRTVLFERNTLLELTMQHLIIVGSALALILVIGIPLGVWLTRPSGRAFLPLASSLLSVGQTFPPIAVLALALAFFWLWPAPCPHRAGGLWAFTRHAQHHCRFGRGLGDARGGG